MSSDVGRLRRTHVILALAATVSLVSLARHHDVPIWLVWLGGATIGGALWWNWVKPSVNGLLWPVAITASSAIVSMWGR